MVQKTYLHDGQASFGHTLLYLGCTDLCRFVTDELACLVFSAKTGRPKFLNNFANLKFFLTFAAMPCDAAVNGADQIFAVRTNHGGNYMPKYRVKVKAIAEVKRHIEIIAESRVKAVEVVKEMMAAELTEEAEEFENWEVCYVHSDMVPAIDNRTRIVDVQNVDDSGDFDSSEDGL